MVQLSLPLRSPFDEDYEENLSSATAECDSTQLIYNNTYCVTSFHFCSDSNPCPSGLPCIDRVCQCLPSKQQYITLAPSPVRMYTAGCNYDKPKETSCRKYEYGVSGVCLLNYCSDEMPCYAGMCDLTLNSCVNITAARRPLPAAANQVIDFGDDPFDHQTKLKMTPLAIILMIAGGIVGLAVVGCLLRTALLGIISSVRWASGGQRLQSNGDEKYEDKDKDSYGNPPFDVKLPMAFSSEPRVVLVRTPTNFNGVHYIPSSPLTLSNNSTPYSTPSPSPQAAIFAQSMEQTRAARSDQSQKSETETSVDIEMKDVGGPQDMTTTDMIVSRSRTQSTTDTMQGASSRTSVSHSTLHKKRSIQSLCSVATTVVIEASHAPVPASRLASTTSSPILAPYTPAMPGSIHDIHPNRLRLDVSTASCPRSTDLGFGSTTPQSCSPSPTSPYSIPSPAVLRSRSLANAPSCRKLPSGFASSPIAKHTERFE